MSEPEIKLSIDLDIFLSENPCFNIIDKNTIEIQANGRKHQVTISDVIQYHQVETRSGSGMRSLGSINGDWRFINNLLETVLEIFEEINPEGLENI